MAKRPAMPKGDPETAALFDTLLPLDDRIVIRPMFGHKAGFVSGNMFSGTFGQHVFVRLDEPSRVELLRIPGAKPFEPMRGRPMTEYVQLPDAFLNDTRQAKAWLARALHWASTLPAKDLNAIRCHDLEHVLTETSETLQCGRDFPLL